MPPSSPCGERWSKSKPPTPSPAPVPIESPAVASVLRGIDKSPSSQNPRLESVLPGHSGSPSNQNPREGPSGVCQVSPPPAQGARSPCGGRFITSEDTPAKAKTDVNVLKPEVTTGGSKAHAALLTWSRSMEKQASLAPCRTDSRSIIRWHSRAGSSPSKHRWTKVDQSDCDADRKFFEVGVSDYSDSCWSRKFWWVVFLVTVVACASFTFGRILPSSSSQLANGSQQLVKSYQQSANVSQQLVNASKPLANVTGGDSVINSSALVTDAPPHLFKFRSIGRGFCRDVHDESTWVWTAKCCNFHVCRNECLGNASCVAFAFSRTPTKTFNGCKVHGLSRCVFYNGRARASGTNIGLADYACFAKVPHTVKIKML